MEMTVRWAQPPIYSIPVRKLVSTSKGIYSIAWDNETREYKSYLFGIHIWDQKDFTWKRVPYSENQDKMQIAPLVNGFSAVAHGQFIYIWGGFHRSEYNIIGPIDLTLYQFDTDTNIWTKPKQKGNIPDNREFHGAVVTDGRMIIFGGAELGFNESYEFYSLDLDTFNWTFLGEFEPPGLSLYRVETSFVFQDRFIYFFTDDEFNNKKILEENLASFDLQEKKFVLTKLDQDNDAIPADGSKLINGFGHGGLLYFFDIYYTRIFLFNPANGFWKKLDSDWNGFGSINDVMVTKDKDKIIVFRKGDPTGHYNKNNKIIEFVQIFNFKYNLQSICIMTALAQNSDISSLPNKIKKEINNFKWIKTL